MAEGFNLQTLVVRQLSVTFLVGGDLEGFNLCELPSLRGQEHYCEPGYETCGDISFISTGGTVRVTI